MVNPKKPAVKENLINGGLKAALSRIAGVERNNVLVGIPREKASRGSDLNNAEILYMHTHGIRKKAMRDAMRQEMKKDTPYSKAYDMYIMAHGSPLWHAPPRPVIEPAIKAHKAELAEFVADAVKAAGADDDRKLDRALNRLGMAGQNFARSWFTDPRNGWAPNSPLTIALKGSSRPLIDTSTLRKSITYVVKRND